jgi:hypothetical protein
MNSMNTIKQPCKRLCIWTRRNKLTPGFSSGPTVLHLHNGQNLTHRSKNTGVTDLIPNGQEVVVYPQEVHASNKQLLELHANQPPPRLRTRSRSKNYLVRQSGEAYRTRGLKCKEKCTYKSFPPLINAARPASSVVAGERREKRTREGEYKY